jgi:hypothetical protein
VDAVCTEFFSLKTVVGQPKRGNNTGGDEE